MDTYIRMAIFRYLACGKSNDILIGSESRKKREQEHLKGSPVPCTMSEIQLEVLMVCYCKVGDMSIVDLDLQSI